MSMAQHVKLGSSIVGAKKLIGIGWGVGGGINGFGLSSGHGNVSLIPVWYIGAPINGK